MMMANEDQVEDLENYVLTVLREKNLDWWNESSEQEVLAMFEGFAKDYLSQASQDFIRYAGIDENVAVWLALHFFVKGMTYERES